MYQLVPKNCECAAGQGQGQGQYKVMQDRAGAVHDLRAAW